MPEIERITFPNEQDQQLSAVIDKPNGTIIAFSIFAHCFAGSKDVLAASRISRALTSDGIAVMRFDFTGLGKSEGDFAKTNFSTNIMDIVSAANYLRTKYEAPKLLVGHSLGGSAVIGAAPLITESTAVATIGSPSAPEHLRHLFAHLMDKVDQGEEAKMTLAGQELTITKQFVEDLAQQDLISILSNWRKAFIIFHSPMDHVVSIDHAAAFYQAAKHPKSFVSLNKADHMLNKREDATYVASVLSAWAKRYICEENV